MDGINFHTLIVLALGFSAFEPAAIAAEKFQRLSGAQIQTRFPGMEMSDDVHWRDSFGRDGSLKSYSMGKLRVGKWRLDKNELCLDLGPDAGGCYQVWAAGRKIELRREGLSDPILEGTLQKPASRK